MDEARSTKAGAETPATPPAVLESMHGPTALNEDRGRDPGDTPPGSIQGAGCLVRSTKAGAETPATRSPVDRDAPSGTFAQRRPGPRPRRHPPVSRRRSPSCSTLNEGRGRDPGDTSCRRSYVLWHCNALNEGRGRDPGDTLYFFDKTIHIIIRSTKAGAETPATPLRPSGGRVSGPALNEGRGRDPGDTLASQEIHRQDVGRSTKAGAETPATHGMLSRSS